MSNIPKIIHYCWFGGAEKSSLFKECLQSWKRKMPDFEIMEWNESNFIIVDQENKFLEQAYAHQKWAFVSDYVRLWVLKEYGGIYLDTDVEVLKRFDSLLFHEGFIGFENSFTLATCLIGAKKGAAFIDEILSVYDQKNFCLDNGELDLTPNVKLITEIELGNGLILNGGNQLLNNHLQVYAADYFSPKNFITKKIKLTDNSYCIHHFNASWVSKTSKKKIFFKKIIYYLLGEKYYGRLKRKYVK